MDDFTGHCGGGRYPLLSTIVQTLRQAGRAPKRRRTDDYAERAPNEYRAVPAQRRQNEYAADRPSPTRRRPEPSFKAANDDYDDFEAADSYRNKNDYLPVRMENMNGRSEYEHDRVTNNRVRQRIVSRKDKDALMLPPRTQPQLYKSNVYSDDVSSAHDAAYREALRLDPINRQALANHKRSQQYGRAAVMTAASDPWKNSDGSYEPRDDVYDDYDAIRHVDAASRGLDRATTAVDRFSAAAGDVANYRGYVNEADRRSGDVSRDYARHTTGKAKRNNVIQDVVHNSFPVVAVDRDHRHSDHDSYTNANRKYVNSLKSRPAATRRSNNQDVRLPENFSLSDLSSSSSWRAKEKQTGNRRVHI